MSDCINGREDHCDCFDEGKRCCYCGDIDMPDAPAEPESAEAVAWQYGAIVSKDGLITWLQPVERRKSVVPLNMFERSLYDHPAKPAPGIIKAQLKNTDNYNCAPGITREMLEALRRVPYGDAYHHREDHGFNAAVGAVIALLDAPKVSAGLDARVETLGMSDAMYELGPVEPVGRFMIEHDGFVGTVIGHYTRLDGEEGVVMQQDGSKVVHVYRKTWLKPAPAAPIMLSDLTQDQPHVKNQGENEHADAGGGVEALLAQIERPWIFEALIFTFGKHGTDNFKCLLWNGSISEQIKAYGPTPALAIQAAIERMEGAE